MPALKNRAVKLLEKLKVVKDTLFLFLFKLEDDIKRKIADAEKNILLIENVEEVAAQEDTLLQKVQDCMESKEITGETCCPINRHIFSVVHSLVLQDA